MAVYRTQPRLFIKQCLLLILLVSILAESAESEPLPQILNLSHTLKLITEGHSSLLEFDAQVAESKARGLQESSGSGLTANVLVDLRRVDRLADEGHRFVDDSRATLIVDKPFVTFGRSTDVKQMMGNLLASSQQLRDEHMHWLRVQAIASYLDIILADYEYAAKDEEMTLAFLTYDDARIEMENFGEVSEIEVTRREAIYLAALAERFAIEHKQRQTRQRLSSLLDRPSEFIAQLVEPDLNAYNQELSDVDEYVQEVLENNRSLTAVKSRLAAATNLLALGEKSSRPVLGFRFSATEYAELFSGSRDQYRASLYLNWPLVKSRQHLAESLDHQADQLRLKTEVLQYENELRLRAMQLFHRLEQVDASIVAANANLLHRELELDKVRLQYEMEIRARIGSANMEVARGVYELYKLRFEKIRLWEQIEYLAGREPSVKF